MNGFNSISHVDISVGHIVLHRRTIGRAHRAGRSVELDQRLFGRRERPHLSDPRLARGRQFHTMKLVSPHFHNRPLPTTSHDDGLLLLEHNAPNGFGGLAELSDQDASFDIPDFNATIAAAAYDARFVELQTCDAIVVGGEAVDGD